MQYISYHFNQICIFIDTLTNVNEIEEFRIILFTVIVPVHYGISLSVKEFSPNKI